MGWEASGGLGSRKSEGGRNGCVAAGPGGVHAQQPQTKLVGHPREAQCPGAQ